MRVEIFTLARGARACIESTRFIIMTVIIINRVDSMHARAPRARVKISTRTFGQPMVKQDKFDRIGSERQIRPHAVGSISSGLFSSVQGSCRSGRVKFKTFKAMYQEIQGEKG